MPEVSTIEATATDATQDNPTAPLPASPPLPTWFGERLDDWILEIAANNVGGTSKKRAKLRTEIRRDVVELARRFAGPSPSALEISLASATALAHVAMKYREAVAYTADGEDVSMRQADHRYKMLHRATTRFSMLVKTMAAVRRAGFPAVQVVNFGGQNQTNVVAQTPAP